jgi:hypothetical protein
MSSRRPLAVVAFVVVAFAVVLAVPALHAHARAGGDSGDTAAKAATPEPGLYLLPAGAAQPDGLVRLHMKMPDKVHQSGTVGMMFIPFKKGHIHETFQGARAGTRTPAGSPDFYFYFADNAGQPPNSQDPAQAMAAVNEFFGDAPPWNATDADQFKLVHLTVEGDARKVETGTVGGSRGSSGNSPDEVRVRVDKLGPHAFHLVPAQPLAPGEYGFYFAAQGPGALLWEFGVDPS